MKIFYVWLNIYVNYFPVIICKEKKNKVDRENLRGHCFVSAFVKHPAHTHTHTHIYIYIYKEKERKREEEIEGKRSEM